jgi:hypothetical protein
MAVVTAARDSIRDATTPVRRGGEQQTATSTIGRTGDQPA